MINVSTGNETNEGRTEMEEFKYISTINENVTFTIEVKAHKARVRKSFLFLIRNKTSMLKLNLDFRNKLRKCVVQSVIFYGPETWMLRNVDKRQIEAFENGLGIE